MNSKRIRFVSAVRWRAVGNDLLDACMIALFFLLITFG